MNKLYLLGDCHLSVSRDWDREAFNKFIDWFEQQNFGNKEECELIQLGDVVEKATNLGDTLELVAKFFTIVCKKFKTIYLIGGNHDHRLVHEKSQYATQFLKYIGDSQIELIFKEQIFHTKNGFHIMALPYRRVEGKILDDYYSNELPEEFYKTKVDLVCGHVAIKEVKSFYGGINISKFHGKHRAFGHIHTRNGQFKEDYCGSIFPFKIDEDITELPRIIKCLTSKGLSNPIEIPQFIKYENMKFGEKPKFNKNSNKLVHIYTIHNCKSVQQAKSEYPNIYIRGIEKIQNQINVKTGEKIELFITPLDALNNLIKETGMIIRRKTLSLLKNILETS